MSDLHITDNDLCIIHGYEPLPDSYYKVCIECGHCYVTAAELEKLDHAILCRIFRVGDPPPQPRAASDIRICPLCSHDF